MKILTVDEAIKCMEHPIAKQLKKLKAYLIREIPFRIELKNASDGQVRYIVYCTYFPYARTTNSLHITKSWPSIEIKESSDYDKFKDLEVKRVLNPRPVKVFNGGLYHHELVGKIILDDESLNYL